jgi:siroheme decarboxylase
LPSGNEEHEVMLTTEDDRRLLARLDDLPLVSRPWAVLAGEAKISESCLLDKLNEWSGRGAFRFTRAFFNSERLGYKSTLLAGAIDPGRADQVAGRISLSPFVSHNFLRTGAALNLWFTLTCPVKGPTLEETVPALESEIGVAIRRFDTVRHFKISFKALMQDGPDDRQELPEPPEDLSDAELIRAIDILQADFPLIERPFLSLAHGTDLSEDRLIGAARILKYRRVLRRVGVVWNLPGIDVHQNVMCLWDAPESEFQILAQTAAGHPRISHCYQRIHYSDWPWKLYTVVHGRDRDDCLKIIDEIGRYVPAARHLELWTSREYKQFPVRYDPAKIVLTLR